MSKGTYTLAELRGRFLTWATVLVIIMGVGSSLLTTYLTRPAQIAAEDVEVKTLVKQLLQQRIDQERAEHTKGANQ